MIAGRAIEYLTTSFSILPLLCHSSPNLNTIMLLCEDNGEHDRFEDVWCINGLSNYSYVMA